MNVGLPSVEILATILQHIKNHLMEKETATPTHVEIVMDLEYPKKEVLMA